jgi:hypothetical protein
MKGSRNDPEESKQRFLSPKGNFHKSSPPQDCVRARKVEGKKASTVALICFHCLYSKC